ncbi:hypothetical protein HKX48_009486 [Thoreauomyces humboldtii]|nr:hypothetical protein HKX48_009486 [Thoreauomyces humboldtii]
MAQRPQNHDQSSSTIERQSTATEEQHNYAADAANALEALSTALSGLRLTRKGPATIPDAAIQRILHFTEPFTFHLVAPLVNRQWRRCARRIAPALRGAEEKEDIEGSSEEDEHRGGWAPRVVMMDLRIVGGGGEGGARTLMEVPRPFANGWREIESTFHSATGTRWSGEGLTVQVPIDAAPMDSTGATTFLNGVLGMLLLRIGWWTTRTEEEARRLGRWSVRPPNVSVVPCQITVEEGVDGDRVGKVLQALRPRCIEVHHGGIGDVVGLFADRCEGVERLSISGVGSQGLDFKRVGELKRLVALEIDGKRPVAPSATKPAEITTDSKPVSPPSNHLAPLSSVGQTLQELRIGGRYPLPNADHSAFLELLVGLPKLLILHTDVLTCRASQEGHGVDPKLLASLFHTPLTELYCLNDPTPEFYSALPEVPASLETLSIFHTNPTMDSLRDSFGLLRKHFPNVLVLRVNCNLKITAADILPVLIEAKKWEDCRWRNVLVEQVPVKVEDVSGWARCNLSDERGFKIRWRGVR